MSKVFAITAVVLAFGLQMSCQTAPQSASAGLHSSLNTHAWPLSTRVVGTPTLHAFDRSSGHLAVGAISAAALSNTIPPPPMGVIPVSRPPILYAPLGTKSLNGDIVLTAPPTAVELKLPKEIVDPSSYYRWTKDLMEGAKSIGDFATLMLTQANNWGVQYNEQAQLQGMLPQIQHMLNGQQGVLVELPYYSHPSLDGLGEVRDVATPRIVGQGYDPRGAYCNGLSEDMLTAPPPDHATFSFSDSDFIWFRPGASPQDFSWVVPPKCGTTQLVLPDGSKYVGSVDQGKPDGYGTETWPNGQRYDGEFHSGERYGFGRQQSSNGDTFEGFFVHNAPGSGQAQIAYKATGWTYEGPVENGSPKGNGILIPPAGSETSYMTGNFLGSVNDVIDCHWQRWNEQYKYYNDCTGNFLGGRPTGDLTSHSPNSNKYMLLQCDRGRLMKIFVIGSDGSRWQIPTPEDALRAANAHLSGNSLNDNAFMGMGGSSWNGTISAH